MGHASQKEDIERDREEGKQKIEDDAKERQERQEKSASSKSGHSNRDSQKKKD